MLTHAVKLLAKPHHAVRIQRGVDDQVALGVPALGRVPDGVIDDGETGRRGDVNRTQHRVAHISMR